MVGARASKVTGMAHHRLHVVQSDGLPQHHLVERPDEES